MLSLTPISDNNQLIEQQSHVDHNSAEDILLSFLCADDVTH